MDARQVFHCREDGKPSAEVWAAGGAVRARKRPVRVTVRFAEAPAAVATLEGIVHANPGDAILRGTVGEQWPLPPDRFAARYAAVPPTEAGRPGTYASVPHEVSAVRMKHAFVVVLLDGRSQLHGGPGDWLLDYGDGTLGVVAAALFPQLYDVVG